MALKDVGYLQIPTGTAICLGQIHEAKNSIQWRIPRTTKHKNSPDGDVKEYIFNPQRSRGKTFNKMTL